MLISFRLEALDEDDREDFFAWLYPDAVDRETDLVEQRRLALMHGGEVG